MTQQGDILLYQTDDGGEINIENGIIEMSGGLGTAVYLSLFGGNEDDDNRDNNIYKWWANFNETDNIYKFNSETQNLLQSLPATAANLRRIEDAVKRDLVWLTDQKIATTINVSVNITGLNRIKISVKIEAYGTISDFEYVENWKAGK